MYKATADPKIVIALGDCAVNCGMFQGSYAVTGPVDRHIPADVRIPGCPPRPAEILAVLKQLRQPVADSDTIAEALPGCVFRFPLRDSVYISSWFSMM